MNTFDIASFLAQISHGVGVCKSEVESPPKVIPESRRLLDEEELFLQFLDQLRAEAEIREAAKNRHSRFGEKVRIRHFWSPEFLQMIGIRIFFPEVIWNWLVEKFDRVGEIENGPIGRPELVTFVHTNRWYVKTRVVMKESKLIPISGKERDNFYSKRGENVFVPYNQKRA